ncbi:MAG: hypothetical protein V4671_20590 [Armatimonadota bacterium]
MPFVPRLLLSVPNRLVLIPGILLLGSAVISGVYTAGVRASAGGAQTVPGLMSLPPEVVQSGDVGPINDPAHALRLLSQSLHRRCRDSPNQRVTLEEETARHLYRLAVEAEQRERNGPPTDP